MISTGVRCADSMITFTSVPAAARTTAAMSSATWSQSPLLMCPTAATMSISVAPCRIASDVSAALISGLVGA